MSARATRPPTVPLIVCFGDSLTAGYQSPTPDRSQIHETPYGAFLQERLGASAVVAVSGVCGELTGEMVMRFSRDVVVRKPAAVVILGGTNDLGWEAAPSDIMRNLVAMYDMALADAIQPVAVTVPSLRVQGDIGTGEGRAWLQGHLWRRHELNRMIRQTCAEKDMPCVDLFSATVETASGLLAAPYSNDGLHLTTEGYRLLADLLCREVFGRPDWRAGAAR
jgi:lysophospholipase L1-like esterase